MKKKLFKNSFIYILGDVLNKAVPFFMLPILTRYLTPEDYGIISVFTVLISIFSVFTGLSIHGAININYFTMTKNELKGFIGNCLILLNISTFILAVIVYLLYPYVVERLVLEIEWLMIAVILAFAQFLTIINLTLWTAEQRPKPYSVYQILQTFTTVTLSLVLIVGFGMKFDGQLLAIAISTILFSMFSLIFIIKRGYLAFQPNKDHIKDALKFGIPLIPHSLAGWIQTGADRIILISALGATATGIYATGYQIALIIGVLVTAFNKAWSPYLYKTLSANPTIKTKQNIIRFTYIYFISIFSFAILFTYISELAIPYFLGKNFLSSSEFILYFAIAFSFQGMYYMVTNYIFYVKKTHILAYVTFCVSILHIVLLYILISINGAIGAAQAAAISNAITFFSVWYLSSKVYKMPWKNWKASIT